MRLAHPLRIRPPAALVVVGKLEQQHDLVGVLAVAEDLRAADSASLAHPLVPLPVRSPLRVVLHAEAGNKVWHRARLLSAWGPAYRAVGHGPGGAAAPTIARGPTP